MEWLFRSEFDSITLIALWSIAAVVVTTVVLFVYTMGLRIATVAGDRRRRAFLREWRDVFATAVLSAEAASDQALPRVTRADRTDLLEEWNRARSIVDGSAADNLIVLARRVGIPELAARLLRRRRVQSQIIAVQTFGHLRDATQFDAIRTFLDHSNTALSITAATSLVEIDPSAGIGLVVPRIHERRDWPKNKVSILLREAGSELISEPMYRAIRSADNENKTFLLQFARLIESEVRDVLVEDLIRESNDPGLLTAALKLVSGYRGVPRLANLTQHEAWYVRMQAARVLGRIGQEEHLSLLESLLDDPEWWVRYRAAQSITSLPFLGPNQLRQLQRRQKDPFAVDILQQSMAEVGLA
ncbi:MAG: HEAT repeat domain-containing protein [Woeseiaceae bacterium]|nr:HEAT repeat domain-containing protein [Woeseiaceae bacterium]